MPVESPTPPPQGGRLWNGPGRRRGRRVSPVRGGEVRWRILRWTALHRYDVGVRWLCLILLCGGVAFGCGADESVGTADVASTDGPDAYGESDLPASDVAEEDSEAPPDGEGGLEDAADNDAGPIECAADQCTIDDACWENEEQHPDNPCVMCLVVVSADAWTTDDTAACDDGDACSTIDTCSGGECVGTNRVMCVDSDPCTDESCDPVDGSCVFSHNTAGCDDGSVCTKQTTCADGACQGGAAALDCNDGSPCTADTCDAAAGCTHTPTAGACDDADDCTADDSCTGGACVGAAVVCDDSSHCTAEACVTGKGCVVEDLAPLCADDNPCTDESCVAEKGCVYPFNSVLCDDGSACTAGDVCKGGLCSGTVVPIDDGNACTLDGCDTQLGVIHTPAEGACDDGDVCTLGDFCAESACQPGLTDLNCDDGNVCTDQSCVSFEGCAYVNNVADCDDDSVCTQLDVCKGGGCIGTQPQVCDDGNTCTTDSCDPGEGCQFALVVSNDCRPQIVVDTPPRGATITGVAAAPSVPVSGTVTSGAGAITSFLLNGVEVAVAEDGAFSTSVSANVGGNTLVFKAVDVLGTERKRVQAYLWSTSYLKPVEPKTGMVDPGIGVWLAQEVIDDGNHSLPADDLATVFEAIAADIKIGDSISNPVTENSQYKVNVNNLKHDKPTIGLVAQPGGMKVQLVVSNMKADVHADGKKIGCIPNPFGSDVCTYYPDVNGDLKVSTVAVTADLELSVVNHELLAKLKNVNVTASGVDLDLNGLLGSLLDFLVDTLVDQFKSELESAFESQIAGALEPQIQGALAGLAFNTSFDMPSLDPAGGSVPIDMVTDFSSVDFKTGGGTFRLRAGAYSPKKTPFDNSGVPGRVGCLEGPQKLVVVEQHPLELALADDFTNALLYAAWNGGLLDFDVPPEMLADVEVDTFGITDLEVKVSGMLAPTMSDCGVDSAEVHIGDLGVTAELILLGTPMTVQMWVSLTAGIEFSAADGELGFGLSEIKSLDSEVTVVQDELIGSEALVASLINDNLVPGLLGSLGGGSFAGVPLPELDLGGGATIKIKPKTVTRASGNTIVGGDLK